MKMYVPYLVIYHVLQIFETSQHAVLHNDQVITSLKI